nr:hypothetical protein [Tanacetum cinerariifolium]
MALFLEEFRQNMTITRSGMTPEAIEELVNRRVEEALGAYEATHAANALEAENQSQNDSDGDNGNGNGDNGNGENGNGGNRNGRNKNPNENGRGDRPVARECTYQDFMKCQSLNFKRTQGVVGLTRWFEKMETVFHIKNYPKKYQVNSISVEVPVAPEVGAAAAASPAGVLELDTYSSLEADPSESSPPPVSVAPMVLPFLCSDDSKSDTEMPEKHVSPTPHDAMLTM